MSMISVFFILLVAVFATLAYFTEPSEAEKRIQERLSGLDRPIVQGEDDHTEIVKHITFSRIGWVDRYLRENPIALQLQLMLEQASVGWTVGRFFFYSACLMLVGAIIGNWWIPVGLVGWIPGLILGLGPLCWLFYQRSARFRRFNVLLPDAIDLIARALRAGHSLPSALVTVAEELADPLGPEFQHCADEMNFGLPFREAMHGMLKRFPLQDLHFLISAILVQRETGGNLAELLDKTAAVLRSRITLQQKVRVHTAQGRMTGGILIALPFIAFVLLNLIRPGYTAPLFESETGHKLVYGTLISITFGALVIRKIIQVKY
jgi:tight adherence protein B